MFDHSHYVPVLRWKAAERDALQNMRQSDKARITPLVELVPKLLTYFGPKVGMTADIKVSRAASEMSRVWGHEPIFVDFWLLNLAIAINGGHPITVFGEKARYNGLRLISVTGLDRSPDYQKAVASLVQEDRRGACIRLRRQDLNRATLAKDLEKLLNGLGLSPDTTDLIVDYQLIDENVPNLANLCTFVPQLSGWRTFTTVGGAFPKDLSKLKKNDQHLLPRRDWVAWSRQVIDASKLPRTPSYGDYTIQHPFYSELDFAPNPSASIRYTSRENWIIMRGEGVRNDEGTGYRQFPAQAQLLCANQEFCGMNFSAGDRYIYQMSLQKGRTGTPTTCLCAGFNHHITTGNLW